MSGSTFFGIGWLAPGWLWGLGAALLPILIHLFSRGPARTIKVGSVAMIAASTSRRARRVRLTDPWLALLRALALAGVALALAGPVLDAVGDGPWGLADPALLEDASWRAAAPEVAARLDALVSEGRLLRLTPGLPATDSGMESDTTLEPGAPLPAWSLLREAATWLPADARIEVFSRGRLAELGGVRPRLDAEVVWHVVDQPPEAALTEAVASTSNEPAESIRVLILADTDRQADADYVAAAIQAIDTETSLDVEVSRRVTADAEAVGDGVTPDALFWLAAEPVPEDLAAVATTVVEDPVGPRFRDCPGRFTPPGSMTAVARRRCAASEATGDDDVAVADDAGIAIGHRLRVPVRFHPSWSDWVLDPSFPRFVADVLDRASGTTQPTVDLRMATAADRQPRSADEDDDPWPTSAVAGVAGRASVSPSLWLLVGALLVAERWLAGRRMDGRASA